MRYRVQVVGWTLIWSGLFVFAYLGWQIYGTDWVNARGQAEASGTLDGALAAADPRAESVDSDEFMGPDAVPSDLSETVDRFLEEPVEKGQPFAFLSVPRLGLDRVVVYEGVDRATLRMGPGHMGTTPLPGQAGNAVVSGHRTTYGRPFYDFDLLAPGDRVEVETSIGTHVYAVREVDVVAPTDIWVTDFRPGGWLTMTTCNPKFSARERLVVIAEMVGGPNFDFVNLHKAKFS
jgi:sortase A